MSQGSRVKRHRRTWSPSDHRLLPRIRRYLTAGILQEGLVSQRDTGMPQGPPLSPLLSSILLDDFDKELERSGHRF